MKNRWMVVKHEDKKQGAGKGCRLVKMVSIGLVSLIVMSMATLSVSGCTQRQAGKEEVTAQETAAQVETRQATDGEEVVDEGKAIESHGISPVPETNGIEASQEESCLEPASAIKVEETADNPVSSSVENETYAREEETEDIPVTPIRISASTRGNFYTGDTLNAADFIIHVTMSDGSVVKNPAGWSADPLYLSGENNTIRVTYAGLSTDCTVQAVERPADPPAVAETAPVRQEPADENAEEAENRENTGVVADTAETAEDTVQEDAPVYDKAWSRQMGLDAWAILNEQRVSAGLTEMAWSEEAFELAYGRSQEIVSDYSHNGRPYGYAETIASGCAIARSVITMWMASQGHQDILMGNYTEGAIAITGGYWAGLFRNPG